MKMMEDLNPEDEKCEIIIQTNGVLFHEENWKKIEKLSRCDLQIIVTPNSYHKQTYKYLAGGLDNLDKMLKNLKFIQRYV